MGRKWSLVLDRLVIVMLAVILLVPPAALPFSDPVPEAFAQTSLPPTYLDTFGSKGNDNGEFGNNGPLGIGVTPSGDVWVMDYKNEHAQKFTSNGDFISLIGSNGNGDNQFKNNGPRDIAVDSDGSFWITDTKAHKIKKFNPDGTFALSVGTGSTGDTETSFNQPSGITIDSLGFVYVADTKNEKIKKYNSLGEHQLTFGSKGNDDGQFKNDGPFGIAIDSSGNIWVTDYKYHRVQQFDSSGNFLLKFGTSGTGDTNFKAPQGIAIDSFDNVWIADTNNDRIVAYDSSGNFLTKYGTRGSDEGEFGNNGPRGIAFDSTSSIFYVSDTKNNRIFKFQNNLGVVASVPGVPTGLTATAGDTEVSLSWTAPTDDGGIAIDHYKVLSRISGSGSWSLLGEIPVTSATVTGLANDSEYEFVVSAHNSVGDGAAASVSATPIASTTTIDPPTELTATVGNTKVTLSWTAPTSGSSDIGIDSIVDNSANLCNGTSCDISITVAEGDNRMIIVATADEDNSPDNVSSIDVGGNTNVGIFVGRENVGSSTDQQVELWRIMESDITTGSNTITVNYASSISGGGIVAMSYSNISQQAEESENSSTVESNSDISTDITTQTDGALVVSVVGNGASGSYSSHGSEQVEGADFAISSGVMSVTNEIKSTTGSDTQSHTSSTTANRQAQYVAVFAPAASSGVSVTDYKIEYSSNSGSSWSTFTHGDASTTETVTGLTNDQEYSFRVSSIASGETSSPSNIVTATPVGESTVPNAPTELTATAGNTEVALSWITPSNDGGSSLTDYVLEYSSDDGSTWIIFDDGIGLTTSAIVTELTNDQEYSFRVSAVNSSGTGTGTPSITITATPVAAGTVPNAPTELTATAGNTEVSLSWTAPTDDGGSSLTDYVVQYRTIDSTIVSLLNNKCLDVVDSSNSANNGANVQMMTCDNSDNQKWNIDGDTITSQLNDKCLDIEGGNTSDGANVLMWTCHGGDNQKWNIDGDTITSQLNDKCLDIEGGNTSDGANVLMWTCHGGDNQTWTESAENEWLTFEDESETAVSTTVSNLINGQEYEFRVFAVNVIGTSSASNVSNATPSVTGTVPNTPTGLSAVPGDTKITLSWIAPSDDGGSLIADYIIEYSSDAGASWSTFTDGTSSSTSVIITGLVNNQEYTFRVSAVNATGTGPTSLHIIATPNPATTLEVRVNHDDDDAEERVSNGDMNRSSSDLELVNEDHEQLVGIRFNDITIPSTAIITGAFVQFTVDETDDDPTNLIIKGEVVANSLTFSGSDGDISDRLKDNTASVSWSSIPAWNTVGEAGDSQKTSDIKSIIQEIINVNGWSSGNSLSIIITGDGKRTADSHDGDSSTAPLLIISYTVPVTVPAAPINLVATGTNQEVSLSWSAPYSGGSPIIDYLVEYRLTTGGWTTFDDGVGITTSASVTELTNDSEYEFRVSAENEIGIGPTSSTVPATPSSIITFTKQVSQPSDDAEEKVSNGHIDLSSSDLELVDEGGSKQEVGIRFNDITIPQGAIISSAFVQFTVDETDDDPTNLTIFAEDVDNSVTFDDDNDNITDRPKTTTSISWSLIPAWNTVGESGNDQKTPDIKTIIQEVIDRSGWNSGNSISIIITGDGERTAESYNGDSSKAPQLIINYSTAVEPPSQPTALTAIPGDTEVSLTWATPSNNGGSPITDYIIEYSDDAGSNWIIFEDGTSTTTSVIIPSLLNGVEYTFRVAAVNSSGTGSTSSTTATPSSLPDAPTTLVASGGNNQVSLTWDCSIKQWWFSNY